MVSVDNDVSGRVEAGRNSVDNKEQQVSEGNSVGGQIVARDYDDSPVPFTGACSAKSTRKPLKSRGEASRTPATREARTSRLTGCAPSGPKEVCIMPNRRGAARPGPDPLADRYVVANIATLAALDNTPGSEQDRLVPHRRGTRRAGRMGRPAGRTGHPVTAPVVPLRPGGDVAAAAADAFAAVSPHLDRCKLAARTVRAYKRQAGAYAAWLAANAGAHGDAFADLVGAEGAVTAWKRDVLAARSSPATVNQALAAVTLMYAQAGLRISVKRVRIPRPGEPDALTRPQEAALRRAAARRGPRDAAIIAVLLDTGARVEECARLDVEDFAITARTGEVRLHGKGDEVRYAPLARRARDLLSEWLDVRGRHPGPIWTGQRGPLTISGVTQVVLAAGEDAGIPGLRPHRARHTFATRLRQGGADPAQVQALLGHASIDTAARYFRAGSAENAEVVERVFSD